MRWIALCVALTACSGSDEQPSSEVDSSVAVDSAAVDSATVDSTTTDTTAMEETDAAPSCFDKLDGTGVTPTSGNAKVSWLRSYVARGAMIYSAGSATTLYVSGSVDTADPPKFDTLAIAPVGPKNRTGYIAKLNASDGTPAWVRSTAGQSGSFVVPIVAMAGADVAFGVTDVLPLSVADKSFAGTGAALAIGVLRADGTVKWGVALPAATDGRIKSIAADGAGNVHAVVELKQPTDIGGKTLDCDQVLIRFDPAGATKWARCVSSIKGSSIDFGGMAVDSAGNSYLSGYPGKEIDLGDGKKIVDASYGGSYVLKVDPDGKTVWSQVWLGAYARSMFVSADGGLYTHGHAPSPKTITIANRAFTKCDPLYEHHITKLDLNGKWQWTRTVASAQVANIATADDGVWFTSLPVKDGDLAVSVAAPVGMAIGKISSSGAFKLLQTFPSATNATKGALRPYVGPRSGSGAVAVGSLESDIVIGGATVKPKDPVSADFALVISP